MFEANGVDDRVELIEGESHDVELPEPATVLVGEVIGNDPFAEQALESFLDARARLLTSNARLIPRAVSLLATPVQVPVTELERWTFGPAATQRWGDTYDLGFDALTAGPGGRTFIEATLAETAHWPRLGPPVTLVRIDLASFDRAEVDVAEEARIDRDGRVTGVLLSFDLDVAEGIQLSTRPGADPVPTSWYNPVWLFPDGRSVGAGERLLIRYRRGAGGEWGVTLDGTA